MDAITTSDVRNAKQNESQFSIYPSTVDLTFLQLCILPPSFDSKGGSSAGRARRKEEVTEKRDLPQRHREHGL
jgi:hypothetical protein